MNVKVNAQGKWNKSFSAAWIVWVLCWLNENVCNSTQKWNYDEYQCECKKLDDWSSCRDDYMWDPNPCYCKCDKTSKIDD